MVITSVMATNGIKNMGAMDMISIVIVDMVDLTSNTGTSVAITSPDISKNIMAITRAMATKGIKNMGTMDMISIVIVDTVDLISNTETSVWGITDVKLL
ncbi:MAG: hypothetical protein GTO60_10045 [Gammaproteobacteria bacterium]|nr:hypothetical protein [Gammaproteobacteria bacterium]NIO62735.1 hypothetical protein [Gammaproteobacteria bacterium]NIQ75977.1 hypothetical protein [Gammaproteobacteria bacterium]NIW48844.1 hypothetical protein [Gammaproteobacteria bacterium]